METDRRRQRSADRLSSRQIQFIALGGAVGAGLFLGSGVGIARAGPAVVLSYAVSGMMIFLVTRALGEMAMARPAGGSFTVYAEDYLGRWAGYATGWCYWLTWVLVCTAELSAAGMFVRFWLPHLAGWIPGIAALALLSALNGASVRVFGEVEFWLSLLKVATILLLIGAGLTVILLHPGADPAQGWQLLHADGGFAPHGWTAVIAAVPIAVFAFGGVEMIGLAAAQADDAAVTLPKAVNGIVIRILLFYVGSLAIVMMLIPWRSIAAGQSPYVLAFQRMGFPAAAGFINLVVLSAVVSSCNSGLFATGRILASLAERGHAPQMLSARNRRGQPHSALMASALAVLIVFAAGAWIPATFFGALMDMTAFLLLFTWGMISVSHLVHRKRFGRGTFPMPFHPLSNIIVIVSIGAVALSMATTPAIRPTLTIGIVWALIVAISFFALRRRRPVA